MIKWLLTILLLLALPCQAQNWGSWNGQAVSGLGSVDGKTVGGASGNYTAWNGLAGLFATVHTFAFVNESNVCCSSTTTQTITFTATTGTVLFVVEFGSGALHIASVSGCGATWTTGSTTNYSVWESDDGSLNAAFATNATVGCTTLTVTLSGTDSGWEFFVEQFSVTPTLPAPTLDALATTTTNNPGCATPCLGGSFPTFTGTKDLVVVPTNWGNNPPVASPYTWATSNNIIAMILNSTSTPGAPSFTEGGGAFQALGFALK